MAKRKRRIYSVKDELIKKSQESALAAIQIFNNPLITFKAESFIVLINIAWPYLLHAYYRDKGIEYQHYRKNGVRKQYDKTKHGAPKHWELERCLNDKNCPLVEPVKDNLNFLIGIRHEIEHQMTNRIDVFISAKFQACCINYNNALKDLFGGEAGLDKTIPIALQLFSFGEGQIKQIKDIPELPQNLIDFVSDFEGDLTSKNNPLYSYRVIYIRDSVNHENQADLAIRFVDEHSAEGKNIQEVLFKNVEKPKYLPSQIVAQAKKKGFPKFRMYEHITLWKNQNAKKPSKAYGVEIGKTWYWYQPWLEFVLEHCKQNSRKYR